MGISMGELQTLLAQLGGVTAGSAATQGMAGTAIQAATQNANRLYQEKLKEQEEKQKKAGIFGTIGSFIGGGTSNPVGQVIGRTVGEQIAGVDESVGEGLLRNGANALGNVGLQAAGNFVGDKISGVFNPPTTPGAAPKVGMMEGSNGQPTTTTGSTGARRVTPVYQEGTTQGTSQGAVLAASDAKSLQAPPPQGYINPNSGRDEINNAVVGANPNPTTWESTRDAGNFNFNDVGTQLLFSMLGEGAGTLAYGGDAQAYNNARLQGAQQIVADMLGRPYNPATGGQYIQPNQNAMEYVRGLFGFPRQPYQAQSTAPGTNILGQPAGGGQANALPFQVPFLAPHVKDPEIPLGADMEFVFKLNEAKKREEKENQLLSMQAADFALKQQDLADRTIGRKEDKVLKLIDMLEARKDRTTAREDAWKRMEAQQKHADKLQGQSFENQKELKKLDGDDTELKALRLEAAKKSLADEELATDLREWVSAAMVGGSAKVAVDPYLAPLAIAEIRDTMMKQNEAYKLDPDQLNADLDMVLRDAAKRGLFVGEPGEDGVSPKLTYEELMRYLGKEAQSTEAAAPQTSAPSVGLDVAYNYTPGGVSVSNKSSAKPQPRSAVTSNHKIPTPPTPGIRRPTSKYVD